MSNHDEVNPLKKLFDALGDILRNLFGSGIMVSLSGPAPSDGQNAGKSTEMGKVRPVSGHSQTAMEWQGAAETSLRCSGNVIANIKGDVSADGTSFATKSIGARKADGGHYSSLIVLKTPLILALENGQIKNPADPKLKKVLDQLNSQVQETVAEIEHPITITAKNPEKGKSYFSYKQEFRGGRDGKTLMYHVYEGEIDDNKKSNITYYSILDENMNSKLEDGRSKITLASPVPVSLSPSRTPEGKNAIMISEQQLWDIGRDAHQQLNQEIKAKALAEEYRQGRFAHIPAGGTVPTMQSSRTLGVA